MTQLPNLKYVAPNAGADPSEKPDEKIKSIIWSGSLLDSSATPGTTDYNWITGSWVIPNAYPPPEYPSSEQTFDAFTWIGFNPYASDAPYYPIRFGTISRVEVNSDGTVKSQYAMVYYKYRDNPRQILTSLNVKPGDLVTGFCWHEDAAHVYLWMVNQKSGEFTWVTVDVDSTLKCRTAEWILGRKLGDYGQVPCLPNYGAVFIHETYAVSTRCFEQEQTVDDGMLIDMVDGLSQTVSTACLPMTNILEIYAYNDESGVTKP